MIEAEFEYSYDLIKDINKSTMRNYNIVGQIALFLILCAVAIIFAVARNILLGVLASVTFVMLLVAVVAINKMVERANRSLLGQKINVSFGDDEMLINAHLGAENIYTAKIDYMVVKNVNVKDGLIYIKIDKKFIVIIPKLAFKTEDDFVKVLERVSNNYVI